MPTGPKGKPRALKTAAKSANGRIPKVPQNATATPLDKAAQDARASDYVSRSKADLATLKGKLGDGKALAAASRNDLANSRTVVADADKREKRPKMTDTEQGAEFERVAREHSAEGDEDAFKGVSRKLAKPKGVSS